MVVIIGIQACTAEASAASPTTSPIEKPLRDWRDALCWHNIFSKPKSA